jgi:hypothetical protein
MCEVDRDIVEVILINEDDGVWRELTRWRFSRKICLIGIPGLKILRCINDSS